MTVISELNSIGLERYWFGTFTNKKGKGSKYRNFLDKWDGTHRIIKSFN